MPVTLFHQPEAGDAPWPAERLLAALKAAGLSAEYQSTAERDWAGALERTHGLAIVAGGDGTVARVAVNMPDRAVPLVVLPMGSANNIARSLGCFGEIEALVGGIAGASETVLTVAEARGRWGVRRFVEAVGLGAIARSTADLQDAKLEGDDKRRTGRDTLLRHVETMPPVRAAICVDGREFSERALLVELMNLRMIGANLPLGPDPTTRDGRFSVVWLPEERRGEMLDWLADPDHAGPPPLEHVRAEGVTLDAHDEPLRIDDKTVEWDGSRISVRLEAEPIRILRPEGAR